MRRARRIPVGLAVIVVMVTLGSAVSAVAANNRFSDVPANHPFFDEISAIEDACVTQGFDDGTFRPSANITRQAEAAFVARAGSRVAMDSISSAYVVGQTATGLSAYEPLLSVTVDVPDLPSCTQYVTIASSARLLTNNSQADTCHSSNCLILLRIFIDGVDAGIIGEHSLRLTSDDASASIANTIISPLGGGTHTIEVRVRTLDVKLDMAMVQPASLVATVTPFGSIQ